MREVSVSDYTPMMAFRQRLEGMSWHDILNARMLGLAALIAWTCLMLMGTPDGPATWNGQAVKTGVITCWTISQCVTLLACAAMARRYNLTDERAGISSTAFGRTGAIVAMLVTSIATAGVVSSTLDFPLAAACGYAGAIASGAGIGVLSIETGRLFSKSTPTRICLCAPCSLLVAAVVFAIATTCSSCVACSIFVFLPVLSGIACLASSRHGNADAKPQAHTELKEDSSGDVQPGDGWSARAKDNTPDAIDDASAARANGERLRRAVLFVCKVGLCGLLVSTADALATSAIRAIFLVDGSLSLASSQSGPYPLLWSTILGVAFLYGSILFSRGSSLLMSYRITMLVIAVCFMILPAFPAFNGMLDIFPMAAHGAFGIIIWILLASAVSTLGLSSSFAFGLGWGMTTAAMVVERLAGRFMGFADVSSTVVLCVVAILAVACVLFSYMFVLKEQDLGLLALPDAADDMPGPDRAQYPRFQDRCRNLAAEYGLTPRETEIMILFAKGRSAARIEEELFIAHGTCLTHQRHIYRKLDVHSKQEMIDLIEGLLD